MRINTDYIVMPLNGWMEVAYQRGFFRRVLHLASEYGWKNPRPNDCLYKYSECYRNPAWYESSLGDYPFYSTDDHYHTIMSYLAEDISSIREALEKAMEDIPKEAVHTDNFNPDIDSDHIDSLYEKNTYFRVIFWSWHRPVLQTFIWRLRDADATKKYRDEMERQDSGRAELSDAMSVSGSNSDREQ